MHEDLGRLRSGIVALGCPRLEMSSGTWLGSVPCHFSSRSPGVSLPLFPQPSSCIGAFGVHLILAGSSSQQVTCAWPAH